MNPARGFATFCAQVFPAHTYSIQHLQPLTNLSANSNQSKGSEPDADPHTPDYNSGHSPGIKEPMMLLSRP